MGPPTIVMECWAFPVFWHEFVSNALSSVQHTSTVSAGVTVRTWLRVLYKADCLEVPGAPLAARIHARSPPS